MVCSMPVVFLIFFKICYVIFKNYKNSFLFSHRPLHKTYKKYMNDR